jgi:hypothetical protein
MYTLYMSAHRYVYHPSAKPDPLADAALGHIRQIIIYAIYVAGEDSWDTFVPVAGES